MNSAIEPVINIDTDSRIMRAASLGMKRAYALLFFEDKHREFLAKVKPVWVSTATPGITFAGEDRLAVELYFHEQRWTDDGSGNSACLADMIRVTICAPQIEPGKSLAGAHAGYGG